MNPMPRTQLPTDLELLKQHAEELWERQQEVFGAAAQVAREAGQQGAGAVRSAAGRVIPAASSALATAAAIGDQGVRQILARLGRLRSAAPAVVVAPPAKKGLGVGGWIGIGVSVVAVGAIAYAVWQTLRADDDLWIEDEPIQDEPVEASADEAPEA